MAFDPSDVFSNDLFAEDDWARSVAYDLVREAAEADDVVQDLWLKVIEKQPTGIESPRAWIRGAVKNIVAMKRRSQGRRRKHEDEAASRTGDSVDLTAAREARDLVTWALDQIRSPYREAIEWRYLHGLDPIEIAEKLDLPATTVRSRLARGLDEMRAALEQKTGKGAAGWPFLLLPLLRGGKRKDASSAASLPQKIATASRLEKMFVGRRKLLAGAIATAGLLLLFFIPRSTESTPKKNESIVRESRDESPVAAANRRESPDRGDPAPRPSNNPTDAAVAPSLPGPYALSVDFRIVEDGAAVDAEILVEASRVGEFSFGIVPRRPLRLSPEESMAFEPVAAVRGRTGERLSIPVPVNGTYRLRISSEIAANAVYGTLAPGITGNMIIQLVRNPRVTIFGIKDETPVSVRIDERKSEPSLAMRPDDGEDDEFRRIDGAFFLPIRIDVALEGIPGKATTRLQSKAATIRLPAVAPLSCAASSAVDDRPIEGLSARSVVFGSHETLWSIETRGEKQGLVTIAVPRATGSQVSSFVQIRAPGFAVIDMDRPGDAKSMRDQMRPSEKNAPLEVKMLPDGGHGGGRILNADGVAAKRGTLYLLSEGPSPVVGIVDHDGRFKFEPVMNTRIKFDSSCAYRAAAPFKDGTVALLYDDEESAMHQFVDVSVADILRGDWIGRLPRSEGRRIEIIDKATRARFDPEELLILPLDKERRTLGFEIFRNFIGRRWPLAGTWLVNARSLRHEPSVTIIDADHDIPPIEMTPRSSQPIEILARFAGSPRPFQAFKFFSPDGTRLSDQKVLTDAEGRLVIIPNDNGKNCIYVVEGEDVLPSVQAPTLLEIGGKYTIDLRRAVSVPISVVDGEGHPIETAAVVIRRPDGGLGRAEAPLVQNMKIILTDEPQNLVVTAPGYRPQSISWTPGPNGEAPPLHVVLLPGDMVRFQLDDRSASQKPIVLFQELVELHDVGSPAPFPPRWNLRSTVNPDDPTIREFRAAPGKYRLRVERESVEVLNRVFDARGPTDLGRIVLEK